MQTVAHGVQVSIFRSRTPKSMITFFNCHIYQFFKVMSKRGSRILFLLLDKCLYLDDMMTYLQLFDIIFVRKYMNIVIFWWNLCLIKAKKQFKKKMIKMSLSFSHIVVTSAPIGASK